MALTASAPGVSQGVAAPGLLAVHLSRCASRGKLKALDLRPGGACRSHGFDTSSCRDPCGRCRRLQPADGLDEAGTAQAARDHRVAADPIVAQHGGRVFKTTGDGVLIEFGSVVGAVECALALQQLAAERNAAVAAERRMEWRIGVYLGDVRIEGDDLLDDGVTIAARLEWLSDL